jgi:hypothetical protein
MGARAECPLGAPSVATGTGAMNEGSARRLPRMIVLLSSLFAALPAAAQEYCVVCSDPSALYRCVIDGAQPQGGQPLQMLCVTAMAKAGGHSTCSVKRGTIFDCDAPVRRVPWTASNAPAATARPGPSAAADPGSTKASPEDPPETVVEMAKRANQQTADQMKKAGENLKEGAKSMGDAMSNATKKTWDCMTSLFTRC